MKAKMSLTICLIMIHGSAIGQTSKTVCDVVSEMVRHINVQVSIEEQSAINQSEYMNDRFAQLSYEEIDRLLENSSTLSATYKWIGIDATNDYSRRDWQTRINSVNSAKSARSSTRNSFLSKRTEPSVAAIHELVSALKLCESGDKSSAGFVAWIDYDASQGNLLSLYVRLEPRSDWENRNFDLGVRTKYQNEPDSAIVDTTELESGVLHVFSLDRRGTDFDKPELRIVVQSKGFDAIEIKVPSYRRHELMKKAVQFDETGDRYISRVTRHVGMHYYNPVDGPCKDCRATVFYSLPANADGWASEETPFAIASIDPQNGYEFPKKFNIDFDRSNRVLAADFECNQTSVQNPEHCQADVTIELHYTINRYVCTNSCQALGDHDYGTCEDIGVSSVNR